jgi:hypothetical protein
MITPSLYDKNIFFAFHQQKQYKILIENKTIIFEEYPNAELIQESKKYFNLKKHLVIGSIDDWVKSNLKN